MDVDHLRSFATVADMLSFRAAAKRLNTSQSALSLQVKKLEESVGVSPLERNRNLVRLTPAGLELKAGLPEVNAYTEALLQRTRAAAAGKIGRLRVGFVSSAAILVLPTIVRLLRQLHPNIELAVHHGTTGQQTEALSTGSLDAGILRVPLDASLVELATKGLLEEPLCLVMPATHPLRARRAIRVPSLKGYAQVRARRRRSGTSASSKPLLVYTIPLPVGRRSSSRYNDLRNRDCWRIWQGWVTFPITEVASIPVPRIESNFLKHGRIQRQATHE